MNLELVRPLLRVKLEAEVESGFPQKIVAGVDEVGRGCLAGPVITACVVLPSAAAFSDGPKWPKWLDEVKDSKKLTASQRQVLDLKIRSWAREWSIGSASPQEIDQLNIHHATLLAMQRAVDSLKIQPQHILVDGKFVPEGLKNRASALIKGDSRSLSIGCASIIAKVFRDTLMQDLEKEYPGYGLATHKGYPTVVHIQALDQLGITPIHRKSFGPVSTRI